MQTPRSYFALFVALAVGAIAWVAPARAEVNVSIANGDKVNGTLNPAGEIETFRIDVPRDAVFKVKVKGLPIAKKQPKPAVTLRLLDPDGATIATGNIKVGKTGATLKGFRAPVTGTYKLQVVGDGETPGAYKLVVKWASATKFRFDLDSAPAAEVPVSLPLDAGATVNLKLKATKGSAAQPAALRVSGAEDFERQLTQPSPGSTSHTLKKEIVPVFGDTVLVTTGGGPYTCTVSVKTPKPAKRSVDLRSSVIGGDPVNGGDDAFGQVIGPGGGIVGVPGGADTAIVGSQVFIPGGGLTGPVPILMGTSSPMPPQSSGSQAAGPTVFFGPEGLQFGTDAQVTIPFDATSFEQGDDLRVFTRDSSGNVTEVSGAVFNFDDGTVTFPTSHFSSFRVFGPRLPPPVTGDFDGDGIGDLVIRAPDVSKVYIFRGGPTLPSTASTAEADWVLTGETSGSRFGEVIRSCDVNQDGRADLVVAAPLSGLSGRVYVFYGSDSFGSRTASQADAVISSQAGDFGFGIRIACADVNGDFVDDVIVGAEGSSVGVRGAGAAYVFLGSREFSSRISSNAEVVLFGRVSGDGFGASVAAGDVTGDGIADVIIGADQIVGVNNGTIPNGTGQVFVFQGGPDLKTAGSRRADFEFAGFGVRDGFGLESTVGDVDGDGIGDVIVAAAGDDIGATEHGAVFVFFGGRLTQPRVRLDGEAAGQEFGFALTTADLDGVLGDELIVSSKLVNGNRGRAYIFAGGPGFASQAASAAAVLVTGDAGNAGLGPMQRPWDVNGSGPAELVLYAPGANKAYVFPGGAPLPASGNASTAPIQIDGQTDEDLGGTTQ